MKKLFLLILILNLFSCNNTAKKETIVSDVKEAASKTTSAASNSKIGKNNFAVIWTWTTTDKDLVINNSSTIANELNDLWKANVIENAYYDADSKIDKFDHFPNITFFLKAHSTQDAEMILNKLTVAKKGIATYRIYPVGTKWLGRKTNTINEKGISNSFVSVWSTSSSEKPSDDITKAQSDKILHLWKNGNIENVYFDIEGTQKANNATDFVFFVNAKTEAEAKSICENLPFAKNNLATFKLLPVGVFWLGQHSK